MALSLPDQGSLRAKWTGKSFWRLRYTDGRVVNEWDVDWSLAPEQGRQALRLCCPNGQVAELGNAGADCTGRFFQFKSAIVTAGGPHGTEAHIIGLVETPNGDCAYAAWLYQSQRLVTGRSNVHAFSFEGQAVGALAFEHLGVRL